jgi:multidrug efflux system membrane fusion protein
MRIKASHLLAAGIALALAGWLASGQLGAGRSANHEASGEGSVAKGAGVTPPLATVRVRDVVAEPIEREVVINGKTAPAREVTLRAETSGRVIELGPPRGAMVSAGDVLLRLDPRERDAMVEEAEATLEMREIEHEAATKLGERGFQADTKVAQAKAFLEAAQAALARTRVELDHTVIRAPFDGVLEARPVEVGDFLDVGDSVATVIEQDPFLVVGEVAEAEVGRLDVGMPGKARLITGQTVEGVLRYIASQADPATRTFAVELEVSNPGGRFAAGVSAELRIVYARTQAHRVAASLLSLDDDGVLGVKAVDDANRVVFHPVDLVRAEAQAVWLGGLPERLRLITVGQGFVRAGDPVRAIDEGDGPPAGPLVAGGSA